MSQHRIKKGADTKDKAAFFVARTPHPKQAELQAQDGAKADHHADLTDAQEADANTLLTPNLLQKMLDAAVMRMQASFTTALAKINNDITDLDARASQLEEKKKIWKKLLRPMQLLKTDWRISKRGCHCTKPKSRTQKIGPAATISDSGVPEDVGAQDLTAFTTELFPASPKEGLELLHKWNIAPNLQATGLRKTQGTDGPTSKDDDH
ncbi:Hypothetical predicted protein [Pelobates cultripes]|uniref:Uncharacterized protein n=1 Tax=Pelobates cultripes TaxID=61616 RepID=A0AAD1RS98_PELCU|nr:Hypothetical predicted protein [Pelobates cultripes]